MYFAAISEKKDSAVIDLDAVGNAQKRRKIDD